MVEKYVDFFVLIVINMEINLIIPPIIVHPLIQVPNQMVAAPKGMDVTIECSSEASPKAINYWTRETGK